MVLKIYSSIRQTFSFALSQILDRSLTQRRCVKVETCPIAPVIAVISFRPLFSVVIFFGTAKWFYWNNN